MLNENAFEQTTKKKQRMRKILMTGCLIGVFAAYACHVFAEDVQMIPPTPMGTMTPCVGGLQQILTYSGADRSTGQAWNELCPYRNRCARRHAGHRLCSGWFEYSRL